MISAMFAFADDLADAADLARIAGYGCDGIAVAAAYHQARDVTPHGRTRVTLRRDGLYFPLPNELFGSLVPPVASDGSLDAIRDGCAEHGLALSGWTVFLHNTTLGLAHPELTQRSCFGEHAAPADLCPAQPEVRSYAANLARAVARTGVTAIFAESLHFGAFGHGYHHERSFVELGPIADFLLGLCFCAACDPPAAAVSQARAVVERALAGNPIRHELTRENLTAQAGPELAGFVDRRRDIVTGLVGEVAEALAEEGCGFIYLDITGALKGYADGKPAGALTAHDSWRLGIDVAAIGPLVTSYSMLAYTIDESRLAADVRAYRSAVGDRELRVILRPGPPDTRDAGHLAAKVRAAREGGADAVDFYNYGMTPLSVLDRIPGAL